MSDDVLKFESCVEDLQFRSVELTALFQYLKQKELIYAKDLLRYRKLEVPLVKEIEARSRFQEVTAQLIWIASNIKDISVYKPQFKRRGNNVAPD